MTLSETSDPAENAPSLSCSHSDMVNAIRTLATDAVQAANSGHPGMPMGMTDVAVIRPCDNVETGAFVEMSSLGASAPIADFYNHFNITSESVTSAARSVICQGDK